MRTSVAINARSSIAVAALHGFAMKAAIVRGLLVGMARRATDFLGSRFVPGAGYIRVAVHAGEHAAVDRIFEGLRIDMQTGRLAVDIVSQRRVAVAREAFVSGGFGWLFAGSVERSSG